MSTRDTMRKSVPGVFPLEISCGTVYVRELSGEGRHKFWAMSAATEGILPSHVIAALALCEPDGSMSYDVDNASDLAELKGYRGADLELIGSKLYRVSGLAKDAVSDAEKKSEASPNA